MLSAGTFLNNVYLGIQKRNPRSFKWYEGEGRISILKEKSASLLFSNKQHCLVRSVISSIVLYLKHLQEFYHPMCKIFQNDNFCTCNRRAKIQYIGQLLYEASGFFNALKHRCSSCCIAAEKSSPNSGLQDQTRLDYCRQLAAHNHGYFLLHNLRLHNGNFFSKLPLLFNQDRLPVFQISGERQILQAYVK